MRPVFDDLVMDVTHAVCSRSTSCEGSHMVFVE